MTSKIVVNNIEADAGVSTVTFGSEISASKITASSTSEFSSGLNVTGTLTCDGITSDGDVTIRSATGNLYIKDTDNDGVVAVQRIVGRDSADNDEWILGQTSTSNSNITLGNVNNAEIIFRTNDTDRLQLSGDGSILYPTTTNAMDIGGSSNQFRNAYFDGTVNCDGLSCNGTATITANAGVLEIQDNNNDGVAAQQRINGIDSASNIDWYLGQTSNTDSDIHLNNVNNNAIAFSTNNTERMRIDSSGNVRIANASSSAPLTVRGGSASASTIHMEGGVNGVDNARISCNQNLVLACNNAGNNAGRVIQFNNNTTTLATIDASANVSIENNGAILFKGNGSRAYFNDASASSVGTSSIGGSTATLFIGNAAIQVSSDVRLKENVEDTQIDALDAISRINVKDFTWNDPSDTSHNNRNARGKWTGLIAQELVEVLPFVVNAPRKEEDGSIDHDSESIWTLDQSQLCPVLIKAIQQQQEVIASQSATIAALDARLTALEGN